MVGKKPLITVLFLFFLLSSIALAASRTFRVQETDFVKIAPEARDLDSDTLTYRFSSPLDAEGEWQTNYGDAGKYEIEVNVSDGKTESSEKILLLVEKKNQPPHLQEKKLSVKETQMVDLTTLVEDPDGDSLTFSFDPPLNQEGKWRTAYGDKGRWVINFTFSDGEFTVPGRVEIDVFPTNRPPVITQAFAEKEVHLAENDTLDFFVKAEDPDGKNLNYIWQLDGEEVSTLPQGHYPFAFDTAGTHGLEVKISDGESEAVQSWDVIVQNVNRKPSLELLPIIVFEGDEVRVDVPTEDQDGDALEFEFGLPLNAQGRWKTDFKDAGTYKIPITASDREEQETQVLLVTVENVDQAPVLNVPNTIELKENEKLTWKLDTSDPDGENITVTFEGLPENALYDIRNHTVVWQPGYDTISRPGGMISTLLNAVRWEHFLLKERNFPVQITTCGSELCTMATTLITVNNVNRPPRFTSADPLKVIATEEASLSLAAEDPDGDLVRIYYSSPFGKRNGHWKTNYEDIGNYTVYITATDGQEGTTLALPLEVHKKNRVPVLNLGEKQVAVNEGQQFLLRAKASDPDGDPIEVWLEDPPRGASFQEGVFLWEPPADLVSSPPSSFWSRLLSRVPSLNRRFSPSQNTTWLRFVASDGEEEVAQVVEVNVKQQNQPPQIIDYQPAEEKMVPLFEPVIFQGVAVDADADALSYEWSFGPAEKDVHGSPIIERTFTSPGKKKISLTVSDGWTKVKKEFVVKVVSEEKSSPVPSPPPLSFSVKVISG